MNEQDLAKYFPNASESTRRANLPAGAGIPDAKPLKQKMALASGGSGKAQSAGCLHCRFTLRRSRTLDVDEKYASIKHVLDFLAACGVICGDKEGQITLEVNQERITKGERETTTIEVFKTHENT